MWIKIVFLDLLTFGSDHDYYPIHRRLDYYRMMMLTML